MTHSFRLSEQMEKFLEDNKQILSNITNIPVEELSDTAVINFCISRVHEDYSNYIKKGDKEQCTKK